MKLKLNYDDMIKIITERFDIPNEEYFEDGSIEWEGSRFGNDEIEQKISQLEKNNKQLQERILQLER